MLRSLLPRVAWAVVGLLEEVDRTVVLGGVETRLRLAETLQVRA